MTDSPTRSSAEEDETASDGDDSATRAPFSLAPLTILGIALVGAGMLLVPAAFDDVPSARVIGGNAPVNRGALNPADISAHNSPSLARHPTNPRNIVISNRIDTPRFSCALHVSTDAGRTFSESPIPVPEGEEAKCYAPDVTFAPDGTLYVSFVTLAGAGNVPEAVWLSRSGDGGRTLTRPHRILDDLAFQVRIRAHPSVPGRLYVTWLQADEVGLYRFARPGNPINLAVSDDQGRTWTPPKRVGNPDRERVVAPVLDVSVDGHLYLVYLDLGDDRLDYEGAHEGRGGPPHPGTFELVLARSYDDGESWVETSVEDALVPTERFIAFIPPLPSLAVRPNGEVVHVAYHDGVLGDADVWVWSSSDGGASFAEVTRANDTPERDGTSQYLPQLALAPGGRLDVIYYDRRADERNIMNEVSLQSSYDEGRTFTRRTLLSDLAFDSGVGLGAERDLPDLGSRLGLLAADRATLAVWTDTRTGTPVSGKQDLAKAIVAFGSPPRLPGATAGILRAGGLALILGAGVLVVRRRNKNLAREEDHDASGDDTAASASLP